MKKKAAIPLTKNSIYSRDNAVYDTAEDSESDDADMELLVKKALNGLKSTLGPTSKSFNQINERLLSAGRATSRNLSTKKGLIVETNWKKDNQIEKAQQASSIYSASTVAAPPLIPVKVSSRRSTLGKGWFDLEPLELDDGVKRDLKIIQMRNYLDPKRFYKNADKIRNVLHVGTVIEGPGEYSSSRLTNKERRQSITEEILADSSIKKYSKKTYLQIQSEKSNKRKAYKSSKIVAKPKKLRSLY